MSNIICQTVIPVDIVKLSKITFAESPIIKQNILSIRTAESNFQIQKSAFDYQLNSVISIRRDLFTPFSFDPIIDGLSDMKLRSRNTMVSTGLQKRFRTGLNTSLSIDYSIDKNNFLLNDFGQSVPPFIEDHSISSTFSLTQPLLKNRGKKITTALEKASLINIESTTKNVKLANSYQLLETVSAYWQYVTFYKNLKIYKENEARVRRVLEITQQLVKADKRPFGDLAQVQADLVNQERQTKSAEQILYSAKLNLGRAIGLNENQSNQLGDPLDQFPTISESGYEKELNKIKFSKIAQNNRADIEAAKKAQEALELQLKYTENNKKPQLDLTGFINYGGMNIGNGLDKALIALSGSESRNFGYGLSLNLLIPINNNLAKGNFIQNEAALKNQEITTINLQRNIDLNVSIALNNLENSVLILYKAKEALELYHQVYKNEQVKFKNGMTILLNLIQFQERLTLAELEYLQAHQQFAIAIANLRYETGTLLVSKKGEDDINKELFFTIPN